MGTVTIDQVPAGSIDRDGLSVVTATSDADVARSGAAYNPATFAAGIPIYFHPLGGSSFLGFFDGYWTAATPVKADAGMYSAHTAVVAPAVAVIDGSSGALSQLPGQSDFALLPAGRLISVASASRAVYTMAEVDSVTSILVWRLDPTNALVNTKTIAVPVSGDTTYNRGLYVNGPYLYLWGSDSTTHDVYTARVLYARLGLDDWSYQTDTGWTNQPILNDDGTVNQTSAQRSTPVTGLSTQGPMSTVVFQNRTFVTVVLSGGGNYTAAIYTSRNLNDPWVQVKTHVIAPTADWLGNNAMLQPQVTVNNGSVPGGGVTAIPYVLTWSTEDSGNEGLMVFWDLLSIPA